MGPATYFKPAKLYSEAFSAATGAACIGIDKMKAFAVEPVRKIECGITQIKETLQVRDQFHAPVFKHLVVGLFFVIEVELVRQAGATAAHYTYT